VSVDKTSDIGNRTLDLPACSILLLCVRTEKYLQLHELRFPVPLAVNIKMVCDMLQFGNVRQRFGGTFCLQIQVVRREILVHVYHRTTCCVQKTLNLIHRSSSRLEVTVATPWK
jgi:hypothetical protein